MVFSTYKKASYYDICKLKNIMISIIGKYLGYFHDEPI